MTLKEYCKHNIDLSKEAEKEFLKDFKENSLYTLSWAEGTIHKITLGRLSERVLKALNKGTDKDKIIKYLKEKTLKYSQWLNSSTSVISNLVKNYEQVARGEFLHYIELYVD